MKKQTKCKCGRPIRYADGVITEGAYQMGQGAKKPPLTFCCKKCMEKFR